MIIKNKVLAVIVARAGSKRIKDKNKKLLGAKPLIMWSIDLLKSLEQVHDILVSTDDPEVAEISKQSGVLVPWMRPAHLATDEASSIDVLIHALDWYEGAISKIDAILLIQPTSPFRDPEVIKKALTLFVESGGNTIISVQKIRHSKHIAVMKNGNLEFPFLNNDDQYEFYSITGGLYLISPAILRKSKSLFSGVVIPIIEDSPIRTLDIDTTDDWALAESILSSLVLPK